MKRCHRHARVNKWRGGVYASVCVRPSLPELDSQKAQFNESETLGRFAAYFGLKKRAGFYIHRWSLKSRPSVYAQPQRLLATRLKGFTALITKLKVRRWERNGAPRDLHAPMQTAMHITLARNPVGECLSVEYVFQLDRPDSFFCRALLRIEIWKEIKSKSIWFWMERNF